jgi:hypothetical protein
VSFSSSAPGPVPEPLSREVARAVLAAVRLERLGLRSARCLVSGSQTRRLGAALLVLREIQLVLLQVAPSARLGEVTIGSCGRITVRVSGEERQPGGVRAVEVAQELSVALRLAECAPGEGSASLRRWSGAYLGWPVTVLATQHGEPAREEGVEGTDGPGARCPADLPIPGRRRARGGYGPAGPVPAEGGPADRPW